MTAITINDVNPRNQYVATAGQEVFIFDFPSHAAAAIKVYQTYAGDTPDEEDDLLQLNVDYIITATFPTATGGTITLTAPASVGDIITIVRYSDYSRSATFSTSAPMRSETIDVELNNECLLSQEAKMHFEKLQLRYDQNAIVSPDKDNKIPVLAAKETWRMNTAGTAIEAIIVEEDGLTETLRADLAQNTVNADGSRLVGHNSGSEATTVHAELLRLAGLVNLTPTGAAMLYIGTTAPTGWVLCNDGTIGNASSGANYANNNCYALFLLIWNSVADMWCPVSFGRGSSAAADWAANKTIRLPLVFGRALIGAGAGIGGLTNRVLGTFGGTETTSLISNQNGPHVHAVTDPGHNHTFSLVGTTSDGGGGEIESSSGGQIGVSGLTINAANTNISIQSSGVGEAHTNMQPWSAWNIIIRL